jgi:hypothetical protein
MKVALPQEEFMEAQSRGKESLASAGAPAAGMDGTGQGIMQSQSAGKRREVPPQYTCNLHINTCT